MQGLRSFAAETDDLAAAIKTLGEELIAQCMQTPPVEFRVEISGTPTALRPLARDEIYRIAGESLRNAFRHSRATRIEVDFYYEARECGCGYVTTVKVSMRSFWRIRLRRGISGYTACASVPTCWAAS